ncbi:NYN domain-containing protein [Nocardioides guangzhouensis]|uniref:NYN domain-containing protein n=1 Tax=Nocardioides guangzhouensis TaxID=2497878 RepID=UPI001FEB603C|nr:NYN domain-containing protein [Nocardioides guangzhouensis]
MALLIDADNAPASKLDLILSELSTFGETNVRRAYGNWTSGHLKQWSEQLHEHAIKPMQQYDYSKGKNASDMAMVVDAMALLYTDHPDAFAIASSDADFTPLVMHLREKGAAVYGFGEQKTPAPFVSACSRFLYLDQLDEPDDPSAGVPAGSLQASTAELKGDTTLVRLLRGAVQASADESGWARVSAVGQHIANQSSFDARNRGYASLSRLIKATDLFELKDEATTGVAVRDKRWGKPKKS